MWCVFKFTLALIHLHFNISVRVIWLRKTEIQLKIYSMVDSQFVQGTRFSLQESSNCIDKGEKDHSNFFSTLILTG